MSFDLKISNGDLAIGSNGDLEKIENRDKLTQDILKIVTTPKGSKRLYPFYGSLIANSLIGTAFPEDFVNTYATSQLKDSIQRLIEMQKIQDQFQYLSLEETIAAIKEVRIDRLPTDPRYFIVTVSVLNRAFSSVEASFEVNTTSL